ncbi:MAG TPA: TetR/AcrR family transcriptional regulator [Anaerolineales bacterium]|nr:TetR/AcrR family transcriptional regulator [Anaerolineales bacterium]
MRTVKKPVERKSEIVAASIELFLKNGYERTSVESIITKLGVAKGCFYHHFRSKEEVFEACIARVAESLLDAYRNILTDPKRTAKQKLFDYMSYNFQLVQKNPSIAETIHSETFEAMHTRVVRESVVQITPVFIRLIEQGQAAGDFQVTNAEFSAVALLGAFQEIHLAYSDRPRLDLKKLKKWIIDLMERILQTKFQT